MNLKIEDTKGYEDTEETDSGKDVGASSSIRPMSLELQCCNILCLHLIDGTI